MANCTSVEMSFSELSSSELPLVIPTLTNLGFPIILNILLYLNLNTVSVFAFFTIQNHWSRTCMG